jgi:hypothetical protein
LFHGLGRHIDIGRDQRGQILVQAVKPSQQRARVPGIPEQQGFPRGGDPEPLRTGSPSLSSAFQDPVPITIRFDHDHRRNARVSLESSHI